MKKLLVVFIILFLFSTSGLIAVTFYSCRDTARQMNSTCRLKQLELALMNYHHDYGQFPPRILEDENGTPMHSWRVLLMPYLEDSEAYAKYDFKQPWNAPVNATLSNSYAKDYYGCQDGVNQGTAKDKYRTRYVAVADPDPKWPRHSPLRAYLVKKGDSKFLLVELLDSDIHWMEPRDQ